MLLSKLEIQGFKSFAKKIDIDFKKGITAIVGPNGSGKSNIADAIRWVLGEQSAKSLRGTKMEDVIFAGSLDNRALAYCEVTLVFDNTDNSLPIEFAQVGITRRVYRSGESEYFVNKKGCRLKDIIELFRDTGIGKEGYSIISQGRVDEILSNKAQERRNVFEEAAGIAKYKARKEEAERKLNKTNDNLQRIEDIIFELEKNKDSLKTKSDKAKIYLELKQRLKEIEISKFVEQYNNLDEKIKMNTDILIQMNQEINEIQEEINKNIIDIEKINAQIIELEKVISNNQQKLLAINSKAEGLEGDLKVFAEKLENSKVNKGRLSKQYEENELLIEQSLKEITSIQLKNQTFENDKQKQEVLSISAEEELELLTKELEQFEAELEEKKNLLYEQLNKISNAKIQKERYEILKNSLVERKESLNNNIEALQKESNELEQDFSKDNALLNAILGDKSAIENEIKSINQKSVTLQEDIALLQNLLNQKYSERDKKTSRLGMIKDLVSSYEGYYSSVKNLLKDCNNNQALNQGVEGVVAQLIKVPQRFETAVEMALGSALQNIVVENDSDAKRLIEYLRRKNYGRATFLPLNMIKTKSANSFEREVISSFEGCYGFGDAIVEYNEKYSSLLGYLLGRIVICDNLDTGTKIAKKLSNSLKIVTLQGDIINPGGSMSGGSVRKQEFSLIGRQREIVELEQAIENVKSELSNTKENIIAKKSAFEELNSSLEKLKQKFHDNNLSEIKQKEKIEMLQKLLHLNKENQDKIYSEMYNIDEQLNDIHSDIQRLDKINTKENNLISQQEIQTEQTKLSQKREQREKQINKLNEYKIAFANIQNIIKTNINEQQRLEKEIELIKNKNGSIKQEINSADSFFDTSNQKTSETNEILQKLNQEYNSLKLEIEANERLKEELRQNNSIEQAKLYSQQDKQKNITDRIHKLEIVQNKSEYEFENIQNQIWEEYSLTYSGCVELTKGLNLAKINFSSTIKELKNKIEELGEINVSAIEDYKEINERYSGMAAQKDDLIIAKDHLNKIISELLTTMKKQFIEQFELINQNFAVTFKELFGDGYAELKLTDTTDVLSSDIDIIARPPGKKLQMLSLLSGGERALTAIALLFSVLKIKPVPFCILDEIEASLDEANVDNFAQYLKRYCDKTQFILITHRKGSMQVCDSLYGVTMEGKGISKLMSVKLSDYKIS